jgi:hypothetical protein
VPQAVEEAPLSKEEIQEIRQDIKSHLYTSMERVFVEWDSIAALENKDEKEDEENEVQKRAKMMLKAN